MHPTEYYGTIKQTKADPYILSFSERYQTYIIRGKTKWDVEQYVYCYLCVYVGAYTCLCTKNLDAGNRQIELLTVDSRGKSWEKFHCLCISP